MLMSKERESEQALPERWGAIGKDRDCASVVSGHECRGRESRESPPESRESPPESARSHWKENLEHVVAALACQRSLSGPLRAVDRRRTIDFASITGMPNEEQLEDLGPQ